MDNLIKTKKPALAIAGLAVAIIFLAGFSALIYKYFEVINEMNRTFSTNPISHQVNELQQEQVSEADLEKVYLVASGSIIGDYLAATAVPGADLAALSEDCRTKLLALTLPAKYKESHLAKVLLLSKIAQDARDGQTASAVKEIEKFKELAD